MPALKGLVHAVLSTTLAHCRMTCHCSMQCSRNLPVNSREVGSCPCVLQNNTENCQDLAMATACWQDDSITKGGTLVQLHCTHMMRGKAPEASPSSSRCTATGTACAPGRARESCREVHITTVSIEKISCVSISLQHWHCSELLLPCNLYRCRYAAGHRRKALVGKERPRTSRGWSRSRTRRTAAGTGRCTASALCSGCCPGRSQAAHRTRDMLCWRP